MIHLFNENTAEKRSFDNIDDLFEFIRNIENPKLLEDHHKFGSFSWSFEVFQPRRVFQLYHNLKKELLIPPLEEAYEQQLDLLEICKGDLKKLIQIPVTPDVDVKYLRKIWCFEYCRAHGYEVREDYHSRNAKRLFLAEQKGEMRHADF